jgi:hypothetical protein
MYYYMGAKPGWLHEIQKELQSFVNRCLRYIMKYRWPRVIFNERLWEMTGQININKEIRKRKFGWIGLDIHSVRMIVSLARQLCSGTHKIQEEGVGQEIHGDELH